LKTYNKIAEYLKKHSEALAKSVKPVKNEEIFSASQPTFQIKLPILSVSAFLENTCDYRERQKRKKLCTYYLLLADAYRRISRFEEATTMVKNARLQLNDMPSADIHFHSGLIYEDMRRFNEAMHEYEQALINDANHKHALLRIAKLHVEQKNYLAARSYLQSAVRIDPTFSEAWYELGIVLKEMGDLQEAGDCFMASLKYYKTSPIMPFELLKRRI
jgi:tetratricopeptide (TPR) repeat protein